LKQTPCVIPARQDLPQYDSAYLPQRNRLRIPQGKHSTGQAFHRASGAGGVKISQGTAGQAPVPSSGATGQAGLR